MSNHRTLGPAEAKVLGATGALLLAIIVLVLVWPVVLVGPAVVIGGWIGIATIVRAIRIRRGSGARERR
jgi:hypothetical protein